eukprot:9493257-Pyramimonas_sp.AAC.3
MDAMDALKIVRAPLVEQLENRLASALSELEAKTADYQQLQRQFVRTNEELKGYQDNIDALLSSRDSFSYRAEALEATLKDREAKVSQLTEDVGALELLNANEQAAIGKITPKVRELLGSLEEKD